MGTAAVILIPAIGMFIQAMMRFAPQIACKFAIMECDCNFTHSKISACSVNSLFRWFWRCLFVPSLFIGACNGYLLAFGLISVFGIEVDLTTMILVGMGAMLVGVNTKPIYAIMIIFEMTQEYPFILPLMLAVIFSTTIVLIFLRGPVHVKHLETEDFKLNDSSGINTLNSIFVSGLDLKNIDLIPDQTSFPQLTS